MLSIGAMSSGQGEYYIGLGQEDYYTKGGEPPGKWIGRGAAAVGLVGQVGDADFRNVLTGFLPNGQTAIQNAGHKDHQAGWDFTFSAPKSVSVIWSQADPSTRKIIQTAHETAVRRAISYLEETAGLTRRGKAGAIVEGAKLIVAAFEHGTSRAQDPQLHTHALILNVGIREDGTTGTILSKPLYQSKMTAGALYRVELAHQLERQLGLLAERKERCFEIKGVPNDLITEFSKRREEILAALEAKGFSGAKAAAAATLTTRQVKGHVAREELFIEWHLAGIERGFSLNQVQDLTRPLDTKKIAEIERRQALQVAISSITQSESHFSERDLVRALAEEAQGRGLSVDQVIDGVKDYLQLSPEIVRLGRVGRDLRYTTKEILEIEAKMLSQVERSKDIAFPLKPDAAISGELSEEQKNALYHITATEGAIKVVSGMAGTGKTRLLSEAREAWEKNGYKVIGAALSGKAAQGLEEGAGIKSETIAKFLYQADRYDEQRKSDFGKEGNPNQRKQVMRRLYAEYKQATWQWSDKTKKKYLSEWIKPTSKARHEFLYATWQISKKHRNYLNAEIGRQENARPTLNGKTVLVIDEAGMVGTRQMARLIEVTEKAGAKIVLVGDAKQLQPIDAGGPFRAIGERIGQAELTDIKRQRDERDREAIKNIAAGRAGKALQSYAERGLLTVCDDRNQAIEALISDWKREGVARPEDSLIITGTRLETAILNRRAQEEMRDAGKLGEKSIRLGNIRFYENDRVLFTKNSRLYNVKNGSLGTVEKVDEYLNILTTRLENGERVSIRLDAYPHLTLGYAITTHKGQGVTIEKSFILAGGQMQDRELSYVQASRARGETKIYIDQIEVGDSLARLSHQMNRSQQKELATEQIFKADNEQHRQSTAIHQGRSPTL